MQNNLIHRGGVPLALRRLMAQPFLETAARLALASPFFISGIVKLLDFAGASAEVHGLCFQPAATVAAAVILRQFAGSPLFIPLRFCWLGPAMLGACTGFVTLLAH